MLIDFGGDGARTSTINSPRRIILESRQKYDHVVVALNYHIMRRIFKRICNHINRNQSKQYYLYMRVFESASIQVYTMRIPYLILA